MLIPTKRRFILTPDDIRAEESGRIRRRDFARKALMAGAGALLLPGSAQAGKERIRQAILSKRGGASYWAELSPPAGTAHSLPTQLFPADNWWNLDISAAPVDPNSATLLAPYTGGFNAGWNAYSGLPYSTVSGNYPKRSFDKIQIDSESDDVPFPIPIPAFTETGWTEWADSVISPSPAINTVLADHDRHLLIVDVDNNKLYEVYQPWQNMTGSPVSFGAGTVNPGELYCYSCCVWDMNTNNQRPLGWTSTDAAGLQVVPGLIKYDEVVGAGAFHAHRVTLNLTPGFYVWPARHQANSGGAVPNGARLRLKPGVNPTSLEPYPAAQGFVDSLKTYGLIVADNGLTGDITGAADPRWGLYDSSIMTGFSFLLGQKLRFSDFEIIELGWGEP